MNQNAEKICSFLVTSKYKKYYYLKQKMIFIIKIKLNVILYTKDISYIVILYPKLIFPILVNNEDNIKCFLSNTSIFFIKVKYTILILVHH